MRPELWDLRVDKIVADLKEGKRIGARKIDETRKLEISHDVSKNADGSARVKLGDNEVVAGVNTVLGTPYPDSHDKGSISVGVDLLPIASPEFEFGPPSWDAIELSRVVDRGIRESKALDFKDLCLVEGEEVLVVFIDAYALNHDGNLFDAAGIACMSALLDAKMPKVEDGKIVKGEFKGKYSINAKPVLNTFAKIGNTVVADPVLSEEKAMTSRFSVSIMEEDKIAAMQKGYGGSFTMEEVDKAISVAAKNSKQIRKLL